MLLDAHWKHLIEMLSMSIQQHMFLLRNKKTGSLDTLLIQDI